METTFTTGSTRLGQVGRFAVHYLEMCIPMCIGFAVGDVIYFSAAGALGYSDPFIELPVLSVFVVTFTMTAPMTAWMLYRAMPRQTIWEMSAVMPIIGLALLLLGALDVIAMGDLALLEHGLMMPAMLVPMLLRPGLYAGHMHHATV